MNTQNHALLNLGIIQKITPDALNTKYSHFALISGALLPDLPMVVFFLWEKYYLHTPDNMIWEQRYYEDHWQDFIDFFNSIPLLTIGFLISRIKRSVLGQLLFCSMLLHSIADLPVHAEDAHRHFWPFFDWKYISPISYWDPNQGGHWFSLVETFLVILSSYFIYQRLHSKWGKRSIIAINILNGLMLIMVWLFAVGYINPT